MVQRQPVVVHHVQEPLDGRHEGPMRDSRTLHHTQPWPRVTQLPQRACRSPAQQGPQKGVLTVPGLRARLGVARGARGVHDAAQVPSAVRPRAVRWPAPPRLQTSSKEMRLTPCWVSACARVPRWRAHPPMPVHKRRPGLACSRRLEGGRVPAWPPRTCTASLTGVPQKTRVLGRRRPLPLPLLPASRCRVAAAVKMSWQSLSSRMSLRDASSVESYIGTVTTPLPCARPAHVSCCSPHTGASLPATRRGPPVASVRGQHPLLAAGRVDGAAAALAQAAGRPGRWPAAPPAPASRRTSSR